MLLALTSDINIVFKVTAHYLLICTLQVKNEFFNHEQAERNVLKINIGHTNVLMTSVSGFKT